MSVITLDTEGKIRWKHKTNVASSMLVSMVQGITALKDTKKNIVESQEQD